jgi:hypothetical protein
MATPKRLSLDNMPIVVLDILFQMLQEIPGDLDSPLLPTTAGYGWDIYNLSRTCRYIYSVFQPKMRSMLKISSGRDLDLCESLPLVRRKDVRLVSSVGLV